MIEKFIENLILFGFNFKDDVYSNYDESISVLIKGNEVEIHYDFFEYSSYMLKSDVIDTHQKMMEVLSTCYNYNTRYSNVNKVVDVVAGRNRGKRFFVEGYKRPFLNLIEVGGSLKAKEFKRNVVKI
jgi:hypothetical protein